MKKSESLRTEWKDVVARFFLFAAIISFLFACYRRFGGGDAPIPTSNEVAAFSGSGTSRAVLIGVDDYFGPDERYDLKYADADVELMRDRLLELGFHSENIVALTTGNGEKAPEFEPNLANLEKTLADLLAKTRPDDSVFVFFSGHGFQTRKLFGLRRYVGFVPSDAARRADGRLDVSTTFSLSKFLDDLAKKEAKFKWVVVDACRETLGPKDAKGGVESAPTLGDRMGALKARAGLVVFQSCGAGEYSYENDALRHSAFTYRLAESLGPKGDTDGDGAVSFFEAISRTTQTMKKARPSQTPSFSCVETRDFILKSRPSAKPETPVAAQDSQSGEPPALTSTPKVGATREAANDEAEIKKPRTETESERLYRLGRALAFGLDGRKIDQAAGFERLKEATDLGSFDAQAELAELYLNGCVGTKADPNEAFDLATDPAKAGNPFAQNVLAICYRDGLSALRDEAKSASYFTDACAGFQRRKNDDVRAATALGERYLAGEGVAKDEEAAARLFLAAAEADYVPAMTRLGGCYANGVGFPQDYEKAAKWLLRAAELNDAVAMTELGACYANGIGVEANDAEASRWYRRAAELGDAVARRRLEMGRREEMQLARMEREPMQREEMSRSRRMTKDISSYEALATPFMKEKDDERGAAAILVGVDDRRDAASVERDVVKMRDALVKIGFASRNIDVLTNDAAGARSIRRTLSAARASVDSSDALFVFFLGRCELAETDGATRSYFLPYAADLNDLETTALAVDELIETTRRDDSRCKTIVFDANIGAALETLPAIQAASKSDGGFACFVSPFTEAEGREADETSESPFTRLFIETLAELDAKSGGPFVEDVGELLEAKVEKYFDAPIQRAFRYLTSDFSASGGSSPSSDFSEMRSLLDVETNEW